MTLATEYVPKSAGRCGHRWRVVRAQCYERDKRADARCWICGKPIDYAAPAGHPDAWEPDHYLTVAEHPECAYDHANIRAAHASCNRRRGRLDQAEKAVRDSLGEPSEDWEA